MYRNERYDEIKKEIRFLGFTRPADPTKADFTITAMWFARKENPKSQLLRKDINLKSYNTRAHDQSQCQAA